MVVGSKFSQAASREVTPPSACVCACAGVCVFVCEVSFPAAKSLILVYRH